MKNSYKQGYVIKDKEIKTINKLVKDITIKTDGRFDGWADNRGMLKGSKIKIKSVRKYKNTWGWNETNAVCYEIDVEVDITKSNYMEQPGSKYRVSYDVGRYVRKTNEYYRSSFKKYVCDELKYFGVSDSFLVISKIKYKYQ